MTPDVLEDVLAVNVGRDGGQRGSRAVPEGDGGAIVAVSSVAAEVGSVDATYATAKGGLHGLIRSLARECGADGVRANAVAPGAVDSPMNDRIVEYLEDRRFRGHGTVDTLLDRYEATPFSVATRRHPSRSLRGDTLLGRYEATPAEVAEVVRFRPSTTSSPARCSASTAGCRCSFD